MIDPLIQQSSKSKSNKEGSFGDVLSVTLEVTESRHGQLEGTLQHQMGGIAGYLAHLDQSNIENDGFDNEYDDQQIMEE